MADMDTESFDRMDLLPLHEGPDVLPHDLIFHTLHNFALTYNDEAVIKDARSGHGATYQQFLSDIVACRNALRDTLDSETMEALRKEREVCILILSQGYEFTVAFFAALAIGAIAVPLSTYRIPHSPVFRRKRSPILKRSLSVLQAR
jgi:acyl-CoA synthetase (AMP-forming)/AMP-acid ligase II